MAKEVDENSSKVADLILDVVFKVNNQIPEARKGVKAG